MPVTAILSDVHSNINALTAVLDDLEKQGGADEVVCLGDVIGYGPRPLEVLGIARGLFKWTLRGNHEEAVLKGATDFNDMAKRAIDWTRTTVVPNAQNMDDVQKQNWSYIMGTQERRVDGHVQFVHGAPQDPINEYIMPMDCDPPSKTYGEKLYTAFTMTPWVTFCGHSHMPALYCQDGFFLSPTFQKQVTWKVESNLRYIINVGSVGQPRDGDNRSCYCLWDAGERSITWRRVHYDIQDTFNQILMVRDLDITLGERLFRGE